MPTTASSPQLQSTAGSARTSPSVSSTAAVHNTTSTADDDGSNSTKSAAADDDALIRSNSSDALGASNSTTSTPNHLVFAVPPVTNIRIPLYNDSMADHIVNNMASTVVRSADYSLGLGFLLAAVLARLLTFQWP
jgi:hypothetical protein